ncbi:MAG: cytochrome c oxidase accessory protein CcoG [Cellvibrionaceae bacterium]
MSKGDPIATDKHGVSHQYKSLYVSDDKIYTRKITGFYQRIRRYTGIPLLAGFLLCPWLILDGRPAILFDLPARKFHVFWLTFWPQDGMYLAWLLIIAAFLLFTVTTLVGRVYCGFTCPQTVWTQMFIWVEDRIQGDRNKRIKLDHQPWTTNKIIKKGSTHFLWLAIALISALTFVGYFVPIRDLISGFINFSVHPVAAFWTVFFSVATYLNAGFMREQVCKYMCPYARFQSVMYDKNTLAVRYDSLRGESRGPRKPNEDYKAKGLGDCTDCSWCVQVCPVDIDIREGTQYECIDCGLCVDACNSVMDKMGYERGLIRYTTQDSVAGGETKIIRPRLLGYAIALLTMVTLFTYSIANRVPVGIDVLRDRGVKLYRIRGENVENVYSVKLNNKDREGHKYTLSVDGVDKYKLLGAKNIYLEEGEILTLPIRLSIAKDQLNSSNTPITFTIQAIDQAEMTASQEARFIGP